MTDSFTSLSSAGSTSITRARSSAVVTKVDVEVLDVDFSKERISLSLKATQSDPWQSRRQHSVDQLVYVASPSSCLRRLRPGGEGSKDWSTSQRWPRTTSSHRSGRHGREELWVKIIELDTRAVASASRSSRPPKVARSPRSTVSLWLTRLRRRRQLHRRPGVRRVHARDRAQAAGPSTPSRSREG